MDAIKDMIRVAGARAVILIEKDEAVEMARVSINGEWLMQGNYWDFHPGCHGGLTRRLAKTAFEWRGVEGLVAAVRIMLPPDVEVLVVRRRYSYATSNGIDPVTDAELSSAERP